MATAAAGTALAATQTRLDKAALVMADAPSEESLTRLLDTIAAADDTLAKARTQATARQTELTAAERSRAALASEEQRAWAKLSSTRDTLVALGAPAIATGAGQDLAAAWARLSGWAADRGREPSGHAAAASGCCRCAPAAVRRLRAHARAAARRATTSSPIR